MTGSEALQSFNSFSINALARRILVAHTETELCTFYRQANAEEIPVLVLGGGTNIVFLDNYAGIVLLNRIAGVAIEEQPDAWYLHVGAGEVWNDLVSTCIEKHIPGLENLVLIPGYVGSAPIQNIGAYGVELQQVCHYVDVLQLLTGTLCRLSADECQFGYRDSIFKHALCKGYAIVAVGFRLSKDWKPVLTYGALSYLDRKKVTPKKIFDIIKAIRLEKLPDPALQGNAGRFFKNPIIDATRAQRLLKRYPDAPYYLQKEGGVKLAAGWLIDRCGLKGYRLGRAAVHEKQAIVLVNAHHATGKDIVSLARYVRKKVADLFAIWLEPEVRFIDSNGEVDAIRVMT